MAARWLAELRRRKVHHALLAYAAACWLLAQVLQFLADAYAWPTWLLRSSVWVFLLGVPVVATVAWFFELTAQGFVEQSADSAVESARRVRPATVLELVVAALAFLGIGFFVAKHQWWETESPPSSGNAPRTLAVLPFKPIVSAARDEALELGMADTLIIRLSGIADVIVSPLSSVRRYSALEQDPLAAGRELNVKSVLDGSVQKDGDQLRVSARLLNVADGRPIWSDRFDEKYTNLLAVQDAIADRVTSALALTLSAAERDRIERRATADPVAYDLFLKGRLYWNRRNVWGNLDRAVGAFEQAVARDPAFALAQLGLADVRAVQAVFGLYPPQQIYPSVLASAQRALELDPGLAEAYATRGHARLNYQYDWQGALEDFDEAVRLDPRYSMAHVWRGFLMMFIGRTAPAISELDRATELEPDSLTIAVLHARGLCWARQYAAAASELERVLEIEPRGALATVMLAQVYTQLQRYDDALRLVTEDVGPAPQHHSTLAVALALSGQPERARAELARLQAAAATLYVPAYDFASIYAALGDHDAAFAWLDRAYAERSTLLPTLRVDPVMDALRVDPRYRELETRLGLPPL